MTYKLQKIKVENFKSIADSVVELSDLNLLIGANSAGKSSLMQALLLLAEASNQRRHPGIVNLNGSLTRLGRFDEVLNMQNPDEKEIVLAVRMRDTGSQSDPSQYERLDRWHFTFTPSSQPTSALISELYFDIEENVHGGFHLGGTIELLHEKDPTAGFGLDSQSGERIIYPSDYLPADGVLDFGNEEISINAIELDGLEITRLFTSERLWKLFSNRLMSYLTSGYIATYMRDLELLEDDPNYQVSENFDFSISESQREDHISTITSHLLEHPSSTASTIAKALNMDASLVTKLLERETEHFESSGKGKNPTKWTAVGNPVRSFSDEFSDEERSEVDLRLWVSICKEAVAAIIESVYEREKLGMFDELARNGEESSLLGSAQDWAVAIVNAIDHKYFARSKEEESITRTLDRLPTLTEWFQSNLADFVKPESGAGNSQVLIPVRAEIRDRITSCSEQFAKFMGDQVRYLGPLREAPKRLHEFSADAQGVGVSGERAVLLLHERGDEIIEFPNAHGEIVKGSLRDGVAYWIHELGIGTKVTTNESGGHGIEVRIQPESGVQAVLLTALGIGVSQVLPVVVMGLISKPGDFLCIEQPELHLHPRMQGQLGDFFWALAGAGRQILIESHSEHILNRLRATIAESDRDQSSRLNLLFAEQFAGITSYRQPVVNELGMLSEDWPTGFLNVMPDESRRILQAALAKQK
jgi:predicted ATPase